MEIADRIVAAATRSFARDGLIATRVEDIRQEAGVSVGAVYHHFADKEAIHTEAWLRALGEYQRAFLEALLDSEDAEQGVKSAVRQHLRWVVDNRDAASLLHSGRPSGLKDVERTDGQNRAFFTDVLRWWRLHASYGALRTLDADVLSALWLGPTFEYSRIWLDSAKATIPKRVETELADAAWATLRAPEPGPGR